MLTSLRTLPPRIYWGAWALAGGYNFLRAIFDVPLYMNFVFNAAHFGAWALLGLLVLPLIRRYPLRMHWRSWLFHLLLGGVTTQIDITLGHWLFAGLTTAFMDKTAYQLIFIAFQNCFHIGLLTYFGFVGIVQLNDALKLARRRDLQIAEHKTACVRAQLQSLKLQLQPHFLFNTLHAIGSLMHYDVATADRMLNRLSDMLRTSLRESDKPLVTLKQEISFIEAYLDIEKIRFEQRLAVEWAIPDHLQDESIPPFILQPLVENAIKYGVAPRADGGRIVIRAYARGASLLLEVEDDAPPQAAQQKGFGIGLSNTRSRLEALYGAAQELALVRSACGTIARISIPLRAPLRAAA
ncbi:sensor histidine kinase [Massilia sp. TSP1-1-2]|uniref:sensor histidine kinase n=1 Tax=Massilia sp. TSP1-1-2 TaxID=2804649 RepID=UPI003CF6A3CC